jgi:hypothetical protein
VELGDGLEAVAEIDLRNAKLVESPVFARPGVEETAETLKI